MDKDMYRKAKLTFNRPSKVAHFKLLHNNIHIFFSDINRLSQFKFHMEFTLDETILI